MCTQPTLAFFYTTGVSTFYKIDVLYNWVIITHIPTNFLLQWSVLTVIICLIHYVTYLFCRNTAVNQTLSSYVTDKGGSV